MVPQQAYANMSVALNKTGHAVSFNMCEWGLDNPWEVRSGGPRGGDGSRTTQRQCPPRPRACSPPLPCRHPPPQWGYDVAQSWRMAGDHTGVWSSTKSTIAASAKIPAANTGRPYGWNGACPRWGLAAPSTPRR